MEPIKDITQKEFYEVLDNQVDKAGNKIKLRSVSYENLMRHLKNIPYTTINAPQIDSSKINLPKESVDWELTPKQYMDYIDGGNKPINVKETMIDNIRKHSLEVMDEKVIDENQTEISNEVELPQQKKVEEVENKVELDSVVNLNIKNDDVDVQKTFEEINNIRQQVLDKKVEADQAQKEADESDKAVQELGVQYTEAQKQLQEAKIRNSEVKKQVLMAINSQSSTLANAKKQYESVINEANKRKEENQNKIDEINPKIKTVEDETISLNNDTARAEEFLNAIYSDNTTQFPYVNEIENTNTIPSYDNMNDMFQYPYVEENDETKTRRIA